MKNVKAILFAEGFVSVSLQFLFMRHLLPQVGSSVVVSTIIVSIFLLFLSAGYHFGGKAKDNHAGQLSKNILLSAAVLGIGLSSLVSELFFAVVSRCAGLHLTLAFYLIIFMAPAEISPSHCIPKLAPKETLRKITPCPDPASPNKTLRMEMSPLTMQATCHLP